MTLNQMQKQHLNDVIEIHLQDFFDNLFDDLRDAGRDYDISLNDVRNELQGINLVDCFVHEAEYYGWPDA